MILLKGVVYSDCSPTGSLLGRRKLSFPIVKLLTTSKLAGFNLKRFCTYARSGGGGALSRCSKRCSQKLDKYVGRYRGTDKCAKIGIGIAKL